MPPLLDLIVAGSELAMGLKSSFAQVLSAFELLIIAPPALIPCVLKQAR